MRRQKKNTCSTAKTLEAGPHETPAMRKQVVILVRTRNNKLGRGVWATTLPVHQTCPSSCPLLDNGCYGQRGPGGHVARLERNVKRRGLGALDVANEEARLIRQKAKRVRQGTPLRLHVSGDCRTAEAAKIVADACREWPGPVWVFTHAWPDVPRSAWGTVSVFASIEDPNEAPEATARGYAPALVVGEHPTNGRSWVAGAVQFIPCPFETRGVACSDCRLCFDADRMIRDGFGIALAAHGSGKKRVKNVLIQLRLKSNTGGRS